MALWFHPIPGNAASDCIHWKKHVWISSSTWTTSDLALLAWVKMGWDLQILYWVCHKEFLNNVHISSDIQSTNLTQPQSQASKKQRWQNLVCCLDALPAWPVTLPGWENTIIDDPPFVVYYWVYPGSYLGITYLLSALLLVQYIYIYLRGVYNACSSMKKNNQGTTTPFCSDSDLTCRNVFFDKRERNSTAKQQQTGKRFIRGFSYAYYVNTYIYIHM